ncbi:hypothetical protein [Streptomyces sp. DH37]|uniref:hypothetical protein n=1 Tax=Streptomyces sp. DH37 TaxID=3040122 RepID=UPI00244151B3|nr:hypothetical protein [Streptomyces sp. DH37]MDG9700735.1 hypothetical protein [Streptomyces sp. DH37]
MEVDDSTGTAPARGPRQGRTGTRNHGDGGDGGELSFRATRVKERPVRDAWSS